MEHWDLVLVSEVLARVDVDEDVVAGRPRRDVQPMHVQVRRWLAKLVDEAEPEPVAAEQADRRPGDQRRTGRVIAIGTEGVSERVSPLHQGPCEELHRAQTVFAL